MSRPKAKEPERDPWSWVNTCENPLEVTEEHVKTVYRINVPRCHNKQHKRNCKHNPYCLSRLGEEKWSDVKNFAGDNYNDPEKERRQECMYVGLKNLGATCYVNSLLQLWFHNLNFRKAIFEWDPLQDPLTEDQQIINVIEEKEILKQLQSVFALMQHGVKRYVDPTDFISSLRLDTSVQQDAQEFSKLFLSKLESVLSYQSQKEVRDLIKDNFCGEYAYVTRCLRCGKESRRPSKFYELDLNIIKGHKTIQDCLKDFMKVEILEGDNKYFCTDCADKEDAQRCISLTELPPVLNLQLMRFCYDKITGYKKKLNTPIQFPERLNMAEFVPNAEGDLEYTLSAVLVHGGRSANSGHYIALIRDSETGIWYKFNDESVEKIDSRKLKFAIEDDCDETNTTKKNKVAKTPPKGSYHSINAYMLVYTRAASPTDENTNMEVDVKRMEWHLPSHLEDFVTLQNEHFENWVLEVRQYNDVTVGRSLDQQGEIVSMITMLPVDSSDEDFDAVPTSCLTKWLNDPDNDFTIDNLKRTCEHGKLRPSDVHEVKYINSEIAERLCERYDANHRFRASEFQCRECVAAQCFKLRFKDKINEEFAFIQKRLKNFSPESEKSYWVGKSSMKTWRSRAKEKLERGHYNANKLSLLEDVHLPKNAPVPNNVLNDCDANKEDKENSPANPSSQKCRVLLTNGGFGDCHYPVPNHFISAKASSPNDDDLKPGESSTPSVPNVDGEVSSSTTVLSPPNDVEIPNKFQNQFCHFVNSGDVKKRRLDVAEIAEESATDTEMDVERAIEHVSDAKVTAERLRETADDTEMNGGDDLKPGENSTPSAPNVDSEVSSSTTVLSPPNDDNCPPNDVAIPNSFPPNDVVIPDHFQNQFCHFLNAGDIKKRRLDDDETSSNTETKLFNDDIICAHGNLCIEETSKRRLVPEDAWRIYRKYFPHAKEFTSSAEPCSLCQNIASEDEVTKGKYRSRAIQEKDRLIDLYHERSRPNLPDDIEYDCMFYILNKEFYASWRRFVKEAGKKEPPNCIQNSTGLLCPQHHKLLYDLSEKVPEALMMVVLPSEWEYLTSQYSHDYEICVNCTADRVISTDPGVCEECMRNRIEHEKQVQLTYTNAKIYVHVLKEENVDGDNSLSADENRPPKQRKLNNGTSSKVVTKMVNGENGYSSANTNGSASDDMAVCDSALSAANCNTSCNLGDTSDPLMNGNDSNNNDSNGNTMCVNLNSVPQMNGNVNGGSQAVRRSARPRRGDKKIEINASSSMVLLDIKKKILEMMEVMPSDQHLFTSDGSELTENSATLADMAIYPNTMLTLKVDKPCAGLNDSDDFSISREREQGFLGTILTSGPCIMDRIQTSHDELL